MGRLLGLGGRKAALLLEKEGGRNSFAITTN